MIATVQAPFADVRAAALRYSLAPCQHPAFVEHRLEIGGYRLELRVLGSSHQAIVGSVHGELHETLACMSRGDGDGRPARFEAALCGALYSFESAVDDLGRAGVQARARRIAADLAADPRAVVAAFPGLPGALTALAARADGDGVAWTTFHLYPQTGEVVTSHSRLAPQR